MNESLPPPLPEDLAALLDAERHQTEPPGVKDRVLRRLAAKLPIDSAPEVHAAWRKRSRARPQVWWWLTRASVGGALGAAQLAVALGAGGAVVVGVSALIKHGLDVRKTHKAATSHPKVAPPGVLAPPVEATPSAPPPPAPSPTPPALEVPAPSVPESTGAVPSGVGIPERHRVAPASAHEVEAPAVPRSDRSAALAEERALLEEARIALLRGDTGSALEALTTHAEKFPNSPFAEEREALMVREAVRAGSYKEARAWFDRFRGHYPNSPLLPVLESSIRELPHEEKN